MEKLYELDDITLLPSSVNAGYLIGKPNLVVEDREDVTGISKSLPIFTSPMEAIVSEENAKVFQDNGIKPILPLTEPLQVRLKYCQWIFCSFSIKEVRANFMEQNKTGIKSQFHICIDAGNGHDKNLLDLCSNLKQLYGGQVILMCGNVGSPETYSLYSRAGIDYMRVGIASGSLVDRDKFGFHFPMASLLEGIKNFKKTGGVGLPKKVKIVADGGINSPVDIIKALALGADYVMIGKQFAKLVEAAGTVYKKGKTPNGDRTTDEIDPSTLRGVDGLHARVNGLCRQYYGNTSPEMRAIRDGYNDIDAWKRAKGKGKFNDTAWVWIDIDSNLSEWLMEFEQAVNYAFMMTGTNNWEDFKKTVRYGLVR